MVLPTKKAKLAAEFQLLDEMRTTLGKMPAGYFQANKLPPLLYQHQLYSTTTTRTHIDRAVAAGCLEGLVVSVPLGGNNNTILVFKQDYLEHMASKSASLAATNSDAALLKRMQDYVTETTSSSFQRESLQATGFSVAELQRLVQLGYLSNRNENTTTLAVPGLGSFTRDMTQGREALIRSIRRKKFKEVLESELQASKIKACRLSVPYHVSDLAGLECVDVIQTSSGRMLRLKLETKKRKAR